MWHDAAVLGLSGGPWRLGVAPLELVLRSLLVYALFLVALRLAGKRELAHPGGSTVRVGQVEEHGALQVDLVATSGEQIGVLDLGPKLDGRRYDRAERELTAEIAGIVADAIVANRPASAPRRRARARVTG